MDNVSYFESQQKKNMQNYSDFSGKKNASGSTNTNSFSFWLASGHNKSILMGVGALVVLGLGYLAYKKIK